MLNASRNRFITAKNELFVQRRFFCNYRYIEIKKNRFYDICLNSFCGFSCSDFWYFFYQNISPVLLMNISAEH